MLVVINQAMLVTGGLNDPRVAYWEPTKVNEQRTRCTPSLMWWWEMIPFGLTGGVLHFASPLSWALITTRYPTPCFLMDLVGGEAASHEDRQQHTSPQGE